MLRKLVRERLIAAADEIFGLFERTMASYEEQLCRAKEEAERHRRQLENVCNTQIVLSVRDIGEIGGQEEFRPQPQGASSSLEQENPQPLNVKEEEADGHVSDLPPTAVSVKNEHSEPSTWSQRHRRSPSADPSEGPDDHLAELSNTDDMQEPSTNHVHCKSDENQLKFSGKETTLNAKPSQKRKRVLAQKNAFLCPICGKTFSLKQAIVQHIRTHEGEKPFCCSACVKSFTTNALMVKHMRIHTGEKPFSCSTCGKAFSQKPHLVSHARTHTGEKPFGCSLCDRTFSTKSQVVQHKRIHTGEKPHTCSICEKSFARRSALRSHAFVHATKGK